MITCNMGITTSGAFFNEKVKVKVAQLCPALFNLMNCSLLGVSVHGILQARTLEWVVLSFSRGSSWTRDQTQVSCLQTDSFPSEPQTTALSSITPFKWACFNDQLTFLLPNLSWSSLKAEMCYCTWSLAWYLAYSFFSTSIRYLFITIKSLKIFQHNQGW